jgi:hypothetical protein
MKQLKLICCLIILFNIFIDLHGEDSIPPTFVSLQIENDTLNNGDTLVIFINAYDSISGIDVIQIGYRNSVNEMDFSLHYFNESYIGGNIYKLLYPISYWARSGKTIIESIVIIDNNSNLFISEISSIDSFYVKSSSPDTIPPVLVSINVEADTVNTKETVTTILEVTDDVSGFLFCNFTLVNPNNEIVEWFYGNYVNQELVQLDGNKYSLDIFIPPWIPRGDYHFIVALYDKQDNGQEYNIQDTSNIFYIVSDISQMRNKGIEDEKLKIYPNPTKDIFHIFGINNQEVNLKIVDINGKCVYQKVIRGEENIDISHLFNGIYEIVIIGDRFIISKKIVKNGH